jgi:Ca2+-transporting ATPase
MQEINNIKYHHFTIGEVFTRLGSTEAGLSEEQSTERLHTSGFNEITETKKEPAWKNLLGQFANLLIMILIIAAIISALMGDIIEAISIVVINCIDMVVINKSAGLTNDRIA